MSEKIAVSKPLVVLHGDEMAQIAFDRILDQFVNKYLDIPLIEIDLSAEKRLLSNGQVVVDAIEALKEYGVGIKNAGMTVNRRVTRQTQPYQGGRTGPVGDKVTQWRHP